MLPPQLWSLPLEPLGSYLGEFLYYIIFKVFYTNLMYLMQWSEQSQNNYYINNNIWHLCHIYISIAGHLYCELKWFMWFSVFIINQGCSGIVASSGTSQSHRQTWLRSVLLWFGCTHHSLTQVWKCHIKSRTRGETDGPRYEKHVWWSHNSSILGGSPVV